MKNIYRTLTKLATATSVLLFTYGDTVAQKPVFDWAIRYGGTGTDYSMSVAVDNSGNVYTAGYFQGTVDFDPGPGTSSLTAAGKTDLFIKKVSATGAFQWVKGIGGDDYEQPGNIALDNKNGYVYFTGNFRSSSVDLDPGPATHNVTRTGSTADGLIVKLDFSGNHISSYHLAGTASTTPTSIRADKWGYVYLAGSFSGSADFDPGPGSGSLTAGTKTHMFAAKYRPDGSLIWTRQIVCSSYGEFTNMVLDSLSNMYASSCFEDTVDFDPGPGVKEAMSAGLMDIGVTKLDSAGNFVWAQHAGGIEPDWGNNIAVDNKGNTYTVGTFDGNANFDPDGSGHYVSSTGFGSNPDAFVLKTDATGQFAWVRTFGAASGGIEKMNAVSVDKATGNIISTGSIDGLVNFDAGGAGFWMEATGSSDMFIYALNETGNFQWGLQTESGALTNCSGEDVTTDPSGNVYLTGWFNDSTDFDPSYTTTNMLVSSAKSLDGFILKLKPPAATAVADIQPGNQLSLYPNPADKFIRIAAGAQLSHATVTIFNALGQQVIHEDDLNGDQIRLEVSSLSAGNYFVVLENAGKRKTTLFSKAAY